MISGLPSSQVLTSFVIVGFSNLMQGNNMAMIHEQSMIPRRDGGILRPARMIVSLVGEVQRHCREWFVAGPM